MHEELAALYVADQEDRMQRRAPAELEGRDRARRERLLQLLAGGVLQAPEDYYHAAMILQHGETLDHYRRAHELALPAAELGYERARWLAAAALDRWLLRQGKPQRFGTQYRQVGDRYELFPVDPATTDAERAAWRVPPLAGAVRQAEEIARRYPPLPLPAPLAQANVPGLTVEVAAAGPGPEGEPAPTPLAPGDGPPPDSLPPGCTPCRLGEAWGAVNPAGRVVLRWVIVPLAPDEPLRLGAFDGTPLPELSVLSLTGIPAVHARGIAGEWEYLCLRPAPGSSLVVGGRGLSPAQLQGVAASLLAAAHSSEA